MKSIHYFHSKINRYIFSKMKDFFSQLQQFEQLINDEEWLNLQSENFSDRLIFIETQPDFSDLYSNDRRIAEDALRLLTDGTYNTIHWKNFFQQAGKRINDKMINYWSCECYNKMIDMFDESKLKNIALLQLELECSKECSEDSLQYLFANTLESQIKEAASQELELLIQKMNNVLNKKKPHWEKYSSEEGLFLYLYGITNLHPFMENESESLLDSQ